MRIKIILKIVFVSYNEDEPNEFILDINEDADYMFSNIPEKEANF